MLFYLCYSTSICVEVVVECIRINSVLVMASSHGTACMLRCGCINVSTKVAAVVRSSEVFIPAVCACTASTYHWKWCLVQEYSRHPQTLDTTQFVALSVTHDPSVLYGQ